MIHSSSTLAKKMIVPWYLKGSLNSNNLDSSFSPCEAYYSTATERPPLYVAVPQTSKENSPKSWRTSS